MQCDYYDARRCRSCTLMGSPYAAQLADKAALAAQALSPVAPDVQWLAPAASAPSHYRNKAKLVVAGRPGRPTFGILDERGRGVDLRRCGLYEPGLAATFDPLHRFVSDLGIEPYDVPGRRGELKHVIVTHSPAGEHLVRFVVRSPGSVDLLRAALPDLLEALPSARVVTANVLPEHKAVLEGDTEVPLTDETLLPVRVGDVTLLLGPRAFLQTNTPVAGALYRQARDWVDAVRPSTVWDLYCGVGGFALHLAAADRRVVGVETSDEAVAAARAAGARIPLRHSRFRHGRRDHPRARRSRLPTSSSSTRPAAASGPASPRGWRRPRPRTSSTRAATSAPWPATSRRCRRCAPRRAASSTCSPRRPTSRPPSSSSAADVGPRLA